MTLRPPWRECQRLPIQLGSDTEILVMDRPFGLHSEPANVLVKYGLRCRCAIGTGNILKSQLLVFLGPIGGGLKYEQCIQKTSGNALVEQRIGAAIEHADTCSGKTKMFRNRLVPIETNDRGVRIIGSHGRVDVRKSEVDGLTIRFEANGLR